MAKSWTVTVPIAGHAVFYLEAETAEEAIAKALDTPMTVDDIEEWDVLERFHQGNICYCPAPWEAEAECDDAEEAEDAE